MHRYRMYGLFVDAPLHAADAAVAFWSAALGARPSAGDDAYTRLDGALSGLVMEVQAVDDAPRYHLDIETDDVPAEVARLIGLGATVVTDSGTWTVLRAPGGHLLCVVPVQSDKAFFAANSRVVD
jgi:predicted RNA-binding protein (virulence factor B family)